jgi:hypothetical protein
MSQYMPSSATCSEIVATSVGSAAQAGMPLERAARSASRPSSATRPERWPMPSTSRATVSSVAPVVAMAISASAAPPAGSVPGALGSSVGASWGTVFSSS